MLSRDRRLPDRLRFRLWADAGSKDAALRRAEPGRLGRWHVRSLAALSLAAVLLAAFAALLALPLQAQTTTPVTLVSNTDRTSSGSTNAFGAQRFETGASTDGYTISEVEVRLSSTGGKSTSVRIREDGVNEPGDLVAELTSPVTLTANSLNTFTAPADTTLAPSTIYWITFNEEVTGARANVSLTVSDDDTGETGWSIGDDRLSRTSETASWSTEPASYLIAIKGTATSKLSGLALEGAAAAAETITLSPAFDADAITYTASVVNRIDSVKLTATKNDSNATVAITDDEDTTTPEEANLGLIVGSNTLTVTVTAENGTPNTYTITVTRAAAPPVPTDCPADTTWCTTMTVGYSSSGLDMSSIEEFGYLGNSNFGDLGSTTFSHGGTTYSVLTVDRSKILRLDVNTGNSDKLNLTVSPALPDHTVLQMDSRTFTVGTDSPTMNAGVEQWDIQDNPLSWTAGQHVTVSLRLPYTDATLSDLALTDGGNAITLTPGFASGVTAYEASVESTVSRITVTPMPSDANASITYLDGGDNALTDAEMATGPPGGPRLTRRIQSR